MSDGCVRLDGNVLTKANVRSHNGAWSDDAIWLNDDRFDNRCIIMY